MFRRTKIVATVGPASESEEQLLALMNSGVDVFRLNFSHGDLQNKSAVIRRIRELSGRRKHAVAILGDLQGPKIRTGLMKNGSLELVPGAEVTITSRKILGEGNLIPTGFAELAQCVVPGERILLDDGLMELTVLSVSDEDVHCQVKFGGKLKDRKGINLPGAAIAAPCLTEKDLEDLQFCIKEEVDYIALSFVRSAADVQELKSILEKSDSDIPVIAKIEKPQALKYIDAIIMVSDGIMVARGDLGVEMNPEQVPLIQKEIIRKCNEAGKPVITATQMLESMIDNPRPTRAETSDVANAILDGTDAVMLSAETASGKYPVEAVSLMVRVAKDVENGHLLKENPFQPKGPMTDKCPLSEAIGQAACKVAESVGAKAILAFTQTGSTAARVSKYRPSLPIYALTPSRTIRRRLALYRGIRAIRVDHQGDTECQINSVTQVVVNEGFLKPKDVVVITMGSPISAAGTTNLLKVHQLEE